MQGTASMAFTKGDEEDELDEFDDVPLHHKRPFGSGLRRKQINFVPASDDGQETVARAAALSQGKSVGDLYLSMVLPKEVAKSPMQQGEDGSSQEARQLCAVCQLPLTAKPAVSGDASSESSSARELSQTASTSHHDASLAHQVCLTHSHPPSALDRSRMGLSYLESYGWDPDSRAGLGAIRQGIKFPIKPKSNIESAGIGLVIPKDAPKKPEKSQKLDAGKVRKQAAAERKKAERLRQHLYSNQDLEKYLGHG